MTAIQKAREALVANGFDTRTLAIADEFMPDAGGRTKAALQIAILDAAADALAALDAETPATPADVGELVERLLHDHVQLGKMTEQASFLSSGAVRVNDPSALMADLREAVTALERVTRERDEARATLDEVCLSSRQEWQRATARRWIEETK